MNTELFRIKLNNISQNISDIKTKRPYLELFQIAFRLKKSHKRIG